ncbi:hypothetical protein PN499_17050 [Kamptonema animale CS-326]|nr:hypothetical protein [Kamptonema animale CS-326]
MLASYVLARAIGTFNTTIAICVVSLPDSDYKPVAQAIGKLRQFSMRL